MTGLQKVMEAAGYISAMDASTRVGWNISTIYRKFERRELLCIQVGSKWFVSIASLELHLGPAASMMLKGLTIPEESRVWAKAFQADPEGTLAKLAEQHGAQKTQAAPPAPRKRSVRAAKAR